MRSQTSLFRILVTLAMLWVGIRLGADLLMDLWWFEAMGHGRVFWWTSGARWALLACGGAFAAATVYSNGSHALQVSPGRPTRPAPFSVPQRPNEALDPLTVLGPRRVLAVVSVMVGLVLGAAFSNLWEPLMMVAHGPDFGFTEPVYGLDAGFYVYWLPVLHTLRVLLMWLILVSALVSALAYLTQGAVVPQTQERNGQYAVTGLDVLPEARRHLASLFAFGLIIWTLGIVLQRYQLLHQPTSSLLSGPGATALNAELPLLTLQAIASAIAAGLVAWGLEKQRGEPLFFGTLMLMVPAGLLAFVPSLYQAYIVTPNELSREAAHIDQHIEATRFAWGLSDVREANLPGDDTLTAADIDANRVTLNNIRLWDHKPLLTTFAQKQEIRTYYQFLDIDNDRYRIDGELRQVMLSPRELPQEDLAPSAQTWVNRWMTYTHGYGLALGPVNEVTEQGLPVLFIQDVPPKVGVDGMAIDRPELYFSEASTTEVLVRTNTPEFDYPAGDQNVYTTYQGKGGVPIPGIRRWIYALREVSATLLFSQDVTANTRVLMHRTPQERVQRLAPWLTLDGDPYLVITEGRLVWVLDGFTESATFPYSRAWPPPRAGQLTGSANYMRNSIKATVDAYDGTVQLYRTTADDPIGDAWMNAFPGLIQPIASMPEDLHSHIRYPRDLFRLQAELYADYHMPDHQTFYRQEDRWEIPQLDGRYMEPYDTVMKLPGDNEAEFIVMLPFTPAEKQNMAAWMIARSDPPHHGELQIYKFPKEKLVYGPAQIDARINQDEVISEKRSLWGQEGSEIQFGTMLVVPIEESLLYVRPLYLQGEVATDIMPELKRVIVAYGDRIVMRNNLEQALEALFATERSPMRAAPDTGPSSTDGADFQVLTDGTPWPELALDAASTWRQAQQAAADGDWSQLGQALDALGPALEALEQRAASVPEVPEVPEPSPEDPPAQGP